MHTTFLDWLWRASWQTSILAIVVLLAQRFFRRQLTAQWRYNLWLLVVIRFLLPSSIESATSIFNLAQTERSNLWLMPAPTESHAAENSSSTGQASTAKPSIPAGRDFKPTPSAASSTSVAETGLEVASFGRRWHWEWTQILGAIWFGGAFLLALHVGWSALKFARRLRFSNPIEDPAMLKILEQCKSEIGTTRSITLLATDAVSTPALYGFARLRLLLPAQQIQFPDREQLRFIFLHEMAHVRRRDIAMNCLMTALQVLHWFNPVAWLAFSRMRADRELACDALVLNCAGSGQRKAYGQTILRMLEEISAGTSTPGLVGIGENKHQLQQRIEMIAGFRPASRWSAGALLLMIAISVGCLTDPQSRKADKPAFQKQTSRHADQSIAKPVSEVWEQRASAEKLRGRSSNTAVWTGKELIVFGGEGMGVSYDDGARYDFAEDSWQELPREGAPSSRTSHTAIWTGDEMIVWGGFGGSMGHDTNRNDGARFDPKKNVWHTVSTDGAPAARFGHSALWTGKEMLIWGGYTDSHSLYQGCWEPAFLNSGGRYNPASDSWENIPTKGAPSKRFENAAVWTGKEMIIWGGLNERNALNDGARYNLSTRTWTPMNNQGAPSPRLFPIAVWTGKEMIVWGGVARRGNPGCFEDGARYNPETDEWKPISNSGAPIGRHLCIGVWTGNELVFWGGVNDDNSQGVNDFNRYVGTGAHYNPATDSWSSIPMTEAPPPRLASSVWTGNGLLVFGGYNGRHRNDTYFLRYDDAHPKRITGR